MKSRNILLLLLKEPKKQKYMKIVCVGDAYITAEMMENGVRPMLGEGDSMEVFFFGLPDKTEMRDIAKMIESGRREEVAIPEGLMEAVEDADLIVVLDDGEINGIGTHSELIENNAIYKEIYESQVKGGKME